MRTRLAVAATSLITLSACGGVTGQTLPAGPPGAKVVVVGIGGIVWEDIRAADAPALDSLMAHGAAFNASVRVTNRAGEAWAILGSAQRTVVDETGGWAFNEDEHIENGTAAELFERRTGRRPHGRVLVSAIEQIRFANTGKAFSAKPGLLADTLARSGKTAAVVGNADLAILPLPAVLPDLERMGFRRPPETGIHREAALAAMDPSGETPHGDVGRSLLEADARGPFGIAGSPARMAEAFREAYATSDLVVVETGDTQRADLYSIGLPPQQAAALRGRALALAGATLQAVLGEIDPARTLVVVFAPTNPGGPQVRGQLRPGVMAGPGIPAGLLTSASTRRAGLVTLQDVSATIASWLGASGPTLGAGHAARIIPGAPAFPKLPDLNANAVVQDQVRTPLSFTVIGLEMVIFAAALLSLRRRGALGTGMNFLLLSAVAFPLATFIALTPVWRAGPVAAGAACLAGATGVAALLVSVVRMRPVQAAGVILGATVAFYLVDLAIGAPMQLDSLLGYTSVAGGRYFGLGNLGFATLAAASLLLAGTIGERGSRARRLAALGLLGATVVWVGYPALGADVGGTLSLIPAALLLGWGLYRPIQVRLRQVIALGAAAVAVTVVFGLIDLARPAGERTHLGDFISAGLADPSTVWVVISRKALLSVNLVLRTGWGLAIPGAALVLVTLHRRSRTWRSILSARPSLSAGLGALIIAAAAGSALNDSGVAIGGMMLAIAAPWALLLAGEAGADGAAGEAGDGRAGWWVPGGRSAAPVSASGRS